MKPTKNLFGTQSLRFCAIAIIALIIGFSFAACSSPESLVVEEEKPVEKEKPNTPDTVAVTGVSLKASTGLIVGGTETLTAAIIPSHATNHNVTWSSSNTAVATVSTGGVVTGVSAGTAIIKVTTVDGGKTASCTVTVSTTAVAVTGVSLKEFTALGVGDTETLIAAITPSHATNQNVTWNSSDTAVATVLEDGLVTGVSAGTAIITVTTVDGGKTAFCIVTVTGSGNSDNTGETQGTPGLSFTLISDNTAYSVSGGSAYSSNVIIPAMYNGLPVTSIGDNAFLLKSPTSVTIPDSVTSIGNSAFWGCASLANITIPNSVTSIGNYAFWACTGLTGTLTIPNSVTTIGNRAFARCTGFTGTLTIPDSVTSIGSEAFSGCTGLTGTLTIPDSVTTIGNSAFAGDSVFAGPGLTEINVNDGNTMYTAENGILYNKDKTTLVAYPRGKAGASFTIPNSVTSIGGGAFSGCTGLTSVTIPNTVTSIGEQAFSYCTNLSITWYYNPALSYGDYDDSNFGYYLRNVIIPDSVTSIGDWAFERYTLISVTIPNSVTTIGNRAFGFNTNNLSITWYYNPDLSQTNRWQIDPYLKTVIIPDNVTINGSYPFYDCTQLTTITVSSDNTAYSSTGGVLYNKDKTTLVAYPRGKAGAFAIPNGVTSIGEQAFYNCTGLTSVTLPDSVTTIGNGAFQSCTGLTYVTTTIGSSVTTIGNGAFQGCTSLANIIIPNGVTSIGDNAFSGSGLTGITIPNSVTSIGDWAFYGCTSLASITITDSVTSIGEHAFNGCTNPNFSIYWYYNPALVIGLSSDYYSYSAFNNYLKIIIIPDSVTSLNSNIFDWFKSLTTINVDANNTAYSSQDGVLYNKSKTTLIKYPQGKAGDLVIPNSVTSIGSAFFNCKSLTSVTIGSGVASIGDIDGCTSLAAINVDAANTAYSSQDGVLYNKSKTTLIRYPQGKADSSFTISASVTSIVYGAFFDCKSLTSVTFQGTISGNNFDSYVFYGDLRDKYLAAGGGIGTYTRSGSGTTASPYVWTKQN